MAFFKTGRDGKVTHVAEDDARESFELGEMVPEFDEEDSSCEEARKRPKGAVRDSWCESECDS